MKSLIGTLAFLVALDAFATSPPFAAVDSEAPSAPAQLVAAPDMSPAPGIYLHWGESSDNVGVAGYDVLRSESSGSGYQKVSTTDINDREYLDIDVEPSTTYYYVVQAFDEAGNLSDYSNEASQDSGPYGDLVDNLNMEDTSALDSGGCQASGKDASGLFFLTLLVSIVCGMISKVRIALWLSIFAAPFFAGCDSNEVDVTLLTQEQLAKYQACTTDLDCTAAIGACCGCPYIGVNKQYADQITINCPDGLGCAISECEGGEAVCVDNICKYLPPCGPDDLTDCAFPPG